MTNRTEKMNMPPSPVKCSVRRPARSMMRAEINVMATLTRPVPRVASSDASVERPADVKILVE